MRQTKLHFIILVVGTLLFLIGFSQMIQITGSTTDGAAGHVYLVVLALHRGLTTVAYYLAFAVLVIGHGVLYHRPVEKTDTE